MTPFGCPYIGGRGPRQSLIGRIAVMICLTISVGGCSVVGIPLGESNGDGVSYGRVGAALAVSAVVSDRVDPTDWEAVRRAVTKVAPDAVANRIEWTNPLTSSQGTVTILDVPIERGGLVCRPLATTINDIRGARRYSGDACRDADGKWRLYGMTADDALLL